MRSGGKPGAVGLGSSLNMLASIGAAAKDPVSMGAAPNEPSA